MGYKNQAEVIKFIDVFINNGFNALEAMREVSPDLKEKSLIEKTSKWIHSDDVMQGIMDRIRGLDTSPEKLRNYFKKVLVMTIDDKSTKPADRMKAIEIMGKLENMFKDHIQIDTKTIDTEDNELYDRYVSRLSTGTSIVFASTDRRGIPLDIDQN